MNGEHYLKIEKMNLFVLNVNLLILEEQNNNPGGLKCFNLFVNLCAKNIVSLILCNFIFLYVYTIFCIGLIIIIFIFMDLKDEVYDALNLKLLLFFNYLLF